jgi:hypothetical protein
MDKDANFLRTSDHAILPNETCQTILIQKCLQKVMETGTYYSIGKGRIYKNKYIYKKCVKKT